MSKVPSYFIRSNLSERQIEIDVASFMTWCTPTNAGAPFRLFDIDESETGADLRFDGGALIYMQFKKSNGLKPTQKTTSGLRPTQKTSTRKNKSKLEEIREFRGEHGLEDNPTLFFQLRAQAKTASDLQHNILLSYERPPLSRAIYVAPLLLDKTAYSNALFNSTRFAGYPFFEREFYILYHAQWTSIFRSVPFLREHISIPPHERVATHDHYFSYSETGVDIAWHSPEVLSREPSRLSDFVGTFLGGALLPENGLSKLDALRAATEEVANQHGHTGTFEGNNNIERLMNHGRWLRKAHGIRQFLLLGNSEKLGEWRRHSRLPF